MGRSWERPEVATSDRHGGLSLRVEPSPGRGKNRRGFVLALNHPVFPELCNLLFREAEQFAQNLLIVLSAQGRGGLKTAGGFAELEGKGGRFDFAQWAERGVGEVFYHAPRLQVRPGEDVPDGVHGPADDVVAAQLREGLLHGVFSVHCVMTASTSSLFVMRPLRSL